MHQANSLTKNKMAPVATEARALETALDGENGSMSNGMTDESFDDYVEHMQDSATFDDEEVLPEEILDTPESPGSVKPAGSDIRREEHWSPKRSFLAETPYFNAYVEKEMHELDIVTSILNDISDRTKAFTKQGSMMADATHRLSLACRLRKEQAGQEEQKLSKMQMDIEMEKRRHALGPEITNVLSVLGDVSFLRRHCFLVTNDFVDSNIYLFIKDSGGDCVGTAYHVQDF